VKQRIAQEKELIKQIQETGHQLNRADQKSKLDANAANAQGLGKVIGGEMKKVSDKAEQDAKLREARLAAMLSGIGTI
ncbi:unnamed protein product, partial [marine sediment metagenome]